jgi:hypothetical protein
VKEYDPEQLVMLVKSLAAKGALRELGQAWLQELLLCLFSLMYEDHVKGGSAGLAAGAGAAQASPRQEQASTPGSSSGRANGSGIPQGLRLKLLQELKTVPLLPVLGQAEQLFAPGGFEGQGSASSGRLSQRIHLPLCVMNDDTADNEGKKAKTGSVSHGKLSSPHLRR